MDNIQKMIQELEEEAATTRHILQVVPEDKLTWRPHVKSMSLGQLAFHIASIPGGVSGLLVNDTFDANQTNFEPSHPDSKAAILARLEDSVAKARQIIGEWNQEKAESPWTLKKGDRKIFTLPRSGVARRVLLNHWYHHRGQLTVYLRLLDVPLPVTYGKSADTNPFA